ncbi:telomere repeats-binding bouquet formation protein 2 isoform X2 [Syngnathus scovelli]|uniref:telomere repeats-binding bouquet formation protein 2 isoform X2 n=1 Tax=Syngnathus scovelli TaxID=161590 RepID=UPI002110E102|nr:telomere repeats-binding bouquet formation protein 2 isoform X2 [Syngnathus scovelli]
MFANKKAWFSSSVSLSLRDFWLAEDGIVTGWKTADYIFSDDAEHPDTLRIFQSMEYIWDKVTVFHSIFLSSCGKRQSTKSVSIGHYVLPPVPVQNAMRNVVGRLIWDHDQPSPQSSADQAADNDEEAEFISDGAIIPQSVVQKMNLGIPD